MSLRPLPYHLGYHIKKLMVSKPPSKNYSKRLRSNVNIQFGSASDRKMRYGTEPRWEEMQQICEPNNAPKQPAHHSTGRICGFLKEPFPRNPVSSVHSAQVPSPTPPNQTHDFFVIHSRSLIVHRQGLSPLSVVTSPRIWAAYAFLPSVFLPHSHSVPPIRSAACRARPHRRCPPPDL